MEIFIQVIGVLLVARVAYSYGYEKGHHEGKIETFNRMSGRFDHDMRETEKEIRGLDKHLQEMSETLFNILAAGVGALISTLCLMWIGITRQFNLLSLRIRNIEKTTSTMKRHDDIYFMSMMESMKSDLVKNEKFEEAAKIDKIIEMEMNDMLSETIRKIKEENDGRDKK